MPASKATSTPDRVAARSSPRFRFVGGKGGVGKTTCAAALGLLAAQRGRRILVVSTDPAPSLGDALDQRLGPIARRVRGAGGLDAVEVDAPAALARWIEARRPALHRIAVRGTWLDDEDVSRLLRLTLPGVDELAGLLEVVRFGSLARYDEVVVDVAPTGHLLRMLAMPDLLGTVARVFDRIEEKHRVVVRSLRGRWVGDDADALIAELDAQAREMHTLLRDPARARVSWVTLPELMVTEETVDALAWLQAQRITVDAILVNRLTPPPPQRCAWCDGRRRVEHAAVAALRTKRQVRTIPIVQLPALEHEPRGSAALRAFGAHLEAGSASLGRSPKGRTVRVTARHGDATESVDSQALAPAGVRLLMFGGKGGVGKTTCAAAAAIDIAMRSRGARLLLLSVDPAHSLGDALGQAVSDVAEPLRRGPPNLDVRELDAARAFAAVQDDFAAAIEELFRRASADGRTAIDFASHDRQVLQDLLLLAPPGLDELAAIGEVMDPAVSRTYDLVVMDTAPTGHAIRLLEMPALVHDWVKTIMSILLKYQSAVRLGEVGATLLRLSQGLGRLREMLTDPARTRFIAVTRTGALPMAETLRLLKRVDTIRVQAPAVIVNATGAGTCSRCVSSLGRERAAIGDLLAAIRRRHKAVRQFILAPAQVPPPRGVAELAGWRRAWRSR